MAIRRYRHKLFCSRKGAEFAEQKFEISADSAPLRENQLSLGMALSDRPGLSLCQQLAEIR
jgi:hypothetical protein